VRGGFNSLKIKGGRQDGAKNARASRDHPGGFSAPIALYLIATRAYETGARG
jgi:hypothetical protein